MSRSAYREAAEIYKQALVALSHRPANPDTIQKGIDIRIRLYWALYPIGEFETLLPHFEAAESLAEDFGDQRRLGTVSALFAGLLFTLGQQRRAVEYGERAQAIGVALDDLTLRIQANFHLGQAHHAVGEYRRATEFFTKHMDSPPMDLTGTMYSLLSNAWVAWTLAELGEFAAGIARGEAVLTTAEALGDQFIIVNALASLGLLHLVKGDLPNATPLLERTLELNQATRDQSVIVWIGAVLGYGYALQGRSREAVTLLERSVSLNLSAKVLICYHSFFVGLLGEAYLLDRRPEAAVEQALLALDISRRQGERGQEAHALKLLGDIASHHESLDEAKAHSDYRQALALAEELGMRPLIAHCYLGLGKLYRRTGKRREAREHLTTATTMYREMEMRFWLEQAEAVKMPA